MRGAGRAPAAGPVLPSLARTAGRGWGASWDGISSGNRESKPIFPDLPSTWPGQKAPHPQHPDGPEALNLALLHRLENRRPLAFEGPIGLFPPAMSPPTTVPPPTSFRHSWTHPVSSTLSPRTVLVHSAPFYYAHKTTPTLCGFGHTQMWPELRAKCHQNQPCDQTSESSSWGSGPTTPGASGHHPCCPTLTPTSGAPHRAGESCLRVSSLLQAGSLRLGPGPPPPAPGWACLPPSPAPTATGHSAHIVSQICYLC